MKILVVIVALIADFKADCRHFSDEPTNQVSNSEEHPLPDDTLNSDFHDEDQYIPFEPENPDSTVVDDNAHDEIILRGKGGKKDLKKLIKNSEFLKYNLTQDNMKMKTELQSLRDNQNNISDTNTKRIMLVLSKMENISNGGRQLLAKINNITDILEDRQVTNKLVHYPYAKHKKSWADAKAFCESIGGQIWTPLDKASTIAAFKACGTLCWNGWNKNSGGTWVTGTGQVKNSSFWASGEPGSSDTAAWSSETGIWGRNKNSLYGWTCQM